MFDRFTDDAKRTLNMARQESQRLNHEYLGTEHMLLGLLDANRCLAVRMLERLGTSPDQVRLEVEKTVKSGPKVVTSGQLPFTLRAKKALEFSMEEARALRDTYIGTEHLLLGLIKEKEGIGGSVLASLGVTLKGARDSLVELRGEPSEESPQSSRRPSSFELELVLDGLRTASSLLRQMGELSAADRVEAILRDLQE